MLCWGMKHHQKGDGPGRDHWFEELADHLGPAYLRYSFTYGTDQEVDFLVAELGLEPGTRILDVGCGPGRHARALAARGMVVHGVDISQRFVELARDGAPDGVTFERIDARAMGFESEFDLVLSLCQGAFGLPAMPLAADPVDRASGGAFGLPGEPDVLLADLPLLERMAAACRPGGRVVLSAFSAYFQVRHLASPDQFDAATGVNHERTEIRDPDGQIAEVDLWTSCFTPRELRLMAAAAGLTVDALWAVTPGGYGARPPDLDHEEFLLVARRPVARRPAAPRA
jgi:SAM-dependent methyltransferase